MGASQSVPENSIHEFTVKDSKGKDVELSIYKGKVLLVVNVASKCGLTNSNYTQLTELYNKYKDRSFEILAFPCNQFLKQEPGTSEQAQEFACTRYKAEYPIFQKMLDSSQTLLSADELKKKFDQEGISLDSPVVTSCGTGVTACVLALGLHRLGKTDAVVYDGSWTEWGGESDTPVSTTELAA